MWGRKCSSSGLILLCLALVGCASSVLKMPKVLPDIVREYKSVTIHSNVAGDFVDTGIQVRKGDTFTILATGETYTLGPFYS